MTGPPEAATPGRGASHGGRDTGRQRVYRFLTLIVQVVLLAGVVWFVVLRDWRNALLTVLVIVLTMLPWFARRLLRVDVPPAFQLVVAVFVFGANFLGTALGFYGRFLWWDTALHTISGFMLGIVGFIVAFLVDGTDRRPEGIRISPLVALFGFMFAVTLGVFWEIYEFVGDNLIPGLDMQVVETGPTDTMVDLIAGTVGAAVVAVVGNVSGRTGRHSFIVDVVCAFIRRNPKLFLRRPE
ncbi:MAG TPA: hypothetical protein VFP34_02085 [Microlunatus sp.]|nr:hypothetical protein [Microlunatus sp.]